VVVPRKEDEDRRTRRETVTVSIIYLSFLIRSLEKNRTTKMMNHVRRERDLTGHRRGSILQTHGARIMSQPHGHARRRLSDLELKERLNSVKVRAMTRGLKDPQSCVLMKVIFEFFSSQFFLAKCLFVKKNDCYVRSSVWPLSLSLSHSCPT
jgi:hypothetical protein